MRSWSRSVYTNLKDVLWIRLHRRAELDSLAGVVARVNVQEHVLMKIAQQIDVVQNQLKEDEELIRAGSSNTITMVAAGSGSDKTMPDRT